MSRVFKSIAPGSSATIEFVGVDGNVTVYVDNHLGAIDLSAADAPALALAILEAAGVEVRPFGESNDAEMALAHLTSHVESTERAAKDAADREALEGEALELFRTFWGEPESKWSEIHDRAQLIWLKTARKAREIHGAPKC